MKLNKLNRRLDIVEKQSNRLDGFTQKAAQNESEK